MDVSKYFKKGTVKNDMGYETTVAKCKFCNWIINENAGVNILKDHLIKEHAMMRCYENALDDMLKELKVKESEKLNIDNNNTYV